MTHPHPEPNAAPEGYDGYVPPAAPPQAGSRFQPQPQQAYQGQQPYPPAPQPQYPAQQPYAGQQAYPSAPQQQYPGQYLPMQQAPMPNPAYGYQQPKSRFAAGLMGIFLGGLGIHRFYLGHARIGVIQLLLTLVVSLFTAGFSLVVAGLWGFIEGIMIMSRSAHFQQDARGIPLRD